MISFGLFSSVLKHDVLTLSDLKQRKKEKKRKKKKGGKESVCGY